MHAQPSSSARPGGKVLAFGANLQNRFGAALLLAATKASRRDEGRPLILNPRKEARLLWLDGNLRRIEAGTISSCLVFWNHWDDCVLTVHDRVVLIDGKRLVGYHAYATAGA
jgi:hypothetical protein